MLNEIKDILIFQKKIFDPLLKSKPEEDIKRYDGSINKWFDIFCKNKYQDLEEIYDFVVPCTEEAKKWMIFSDTAKVSNPDIIRFLWLDDHNEWLTDKQVNNFKKRICQIEDEVCENGMCAYWRKRA